MNCVTLNQLQYIVKEKDTTVWEPTLGGNGGFSVSVLQTLNSPRQVVILSATLDGIAIDIEDTATSGSLVVVEKELEVAANVEQVVTMGLAIEQGTFVLQAVEEVNGNERILASVTQQAGDVTTDGGGMHTQSFQLRILPSTGNIKLRLSSIPLTMGNRSKATGKWITKKIKYLEQENIVVTLCDSTADRYRFGFNGQEKVNELAGLGNHNTAEFWEYDTRLGRRWNLDPVDQISISNYAVNGNSPILMNDPNGDVTGDYYTTEGKYLGKDEKSDNEVYTTSQGNFDYQTGVTSNSKPDYDALRKSSNLLKDDKGNNLRHDKFLNMAATVFGESTAYKTNGATDNLKKEMGGIAYVHKNNDLAFAASDGNAQVALFKNTPLAKQTPKMQLANWSIINAYTNGYDYSNGADMWDGAEQAIFPASNNDRSVKYGKRSFELHMNTMGWDISDEHYKIWKNNVGSSFQAPQRKAAPDNFGGYKNKGKMILKSTAVYGQTIFWKDTSKPKAK